MKIEVGKKYKSSSGNVFEIFTKHPNLDLLIAINVISQSISTFTKTGVNKEGNVLIEEYTEPKKLSGWINIYDGLSVYYSSKAEAKEDQKLQTAHCLACINLEQFNEGEGLND